jgi:hypothetical protein
MSSETRKTFKEGDFIKHIYPYENEGEYLITKETQYGYDCARLKGEHVPENDFKNLMTLSFYEARTSYEKVG